MQSYDPSKLSSYLMNYDLNNLYGWAMCQPLPYVDFRWVYDTSNFNIMDIALDSPTDYILEVDLEYPQHLHDAHTDLPFCPTRDKPPGNGRTNSSQLYIIRSATSYIIVTYSSVLVTISVLQRFTAYCNSCNHRGFARISSLTRILEHSPRMILKKIYTN